MRKAGEMQLGSNCSGCKAAKYCSKLCQAAAWKTGHRDVCTYAVDDQGQQQKHKPTAQVTELAGFSEGCGRGGHAGLFLGSEMQ